MLLSFTTFDETQNINTTGAFRLYEDKAGNLWIAVKGRVYKYNGNTFTMFNEKDGLKNIGVQSMYEDKVGNFWFGTGAGLFLFNRKTFINVTKESNWPQRFR